MTDYAQYDLNEAQMFIFKLLEKMNNSTVNELAKILLDNRYTWFSVATMHNQNFLTPSELVDGGFYADGIVVYTDVGGEKVLIPIFKKVKDVTVNFITMRPADAVVDKDTPFPDEATAFINIAWEPSDDVNEKFAKNIK